MYLTYDEFSEMGGVIEEEAVFNRYEAKARVQIDRATFGRLRDEADIPESVKYCMYELISAIQANDSMAGLSAGREVASMSNDGVSVTFASGLSSTGSMQTQDKRNLAIIRGWLAGETTACGLPLLYAGVDA